MGLWKFGQNVPERELEDTAKEWAGNPKYIEVYIRKVSKDQIGIGFAYEGGETKENYDIYFDKTSDQLKRQFGNGLVGWDIASSSKIIKGF